MLTQKYLLLHQRATCILEMIERCNRMKKDALIYLLNNQEAPWFNYTKGHYEKQLHKYAAVKKRLVIAYSNTIQKIINPVLNNATEIGNFSINEKGIAVV